MNIDLDTYSCCSHCGQKAGINESKEKYECELYPYESKDEFKLLCIECVKKELNQINCESKKREVTCHYDELLGSLFYVFSKTE